MFSCKNVGKIQAKKVAGRSSFTLSGITSVLEIPQVLERQETSVSYDFLFIFYIFYFCFSLLANFFKLKFISTEERTRAGDLLKRAS